MGKKTVDVERRQKRAYDYRDSIRPGDEVAIFCTESSPEFGQFKMTDQTLSIRQPEDRAPFEKGRPELLICREVRIGRNGYGFFVDYHFDLPGVGTVIINGPDAQWLREMGIKAGLIKPDEAGKGVR